MNQPKAMTAEQAFVRLSALCAHAEHCQQDMLDKMRRWNLSAEEQAEVMQRLLEGRYVDDERYCRAFVRDKIEYNKWGRRKIEQALWLKHIDPDVSQRVLEETSAADYATILRPLLQQKRRTTSAANDYQLRTKLMKWALGRGFTMDVISQCLSTDDMHQPDLNDDADEFLDTDF